MGEFRNFSDVRREVGDDLRPATRGRLDEQILEAARKANKLLGTSTGLAEGSRLGIGATRLWYRDPATGRVRPARTEDGAEYCFTTA